MIHLLGSLLTRALREGLIVRALAWPGLLTAIAVLLSAGAVATLNTTERLAVEDAELAAALEEAGLRPELVEDAEALLAAGEVERAIWREGEDWVLGLRSSGRGALEVESALRDHAGAAWTIELPPLSRRDPRMGPVTRLLVGMMAVLFTLYGVVFGAASLLRDREDGTLEAERALAVRETAHAWARLVAAALLLAVGFVLSVGLVHALLGVPRPLAWCATGSVAGLAASALGLGVMSRGGTLSRPLAFGMSLSMGLLGLGWGLPELGRHLPIASVGALVRGEVPSPAALLLALAMAWLATRVFARSVR